MRRDVLDVIFTFLLLALIGWTTYEARNWDARARLFPWAAGIPVLVLLVVQLVRQVRLSITSREPSLIFSDVENPHEALRRTFNIAAWMLGFAIAIWAIGFAIGGTLLSLIYLRFAAREKWPITLAITVGTGLFFWLMIAYLHVPFPRGVILDAIT